MIKTLDDSIQNHQDIASDESNSGKVSIEEKCKVNDSIEGDGIKLAALEYDSVVSKVTLECLFNLPFGNFTEIERAGLSLTYIDTTDCASSLASLQSLAKKLQEKDPTKLEYREPNVSAVATPAGRDSYEHEDTVVAEKVCGSVQDSEIKTIENSDCQDAETRVNYSATDN
ncbi:unnamed protein product [Euphydryas editha]|uniref:Uncharacterized protein n=1 Tax=Euphydryas editha TaxID=104508 RepID=A0AAU9U917_EUPED|nr:unnamed protein product [Euphydryas editha]